MAHYFTGTGDDGYTAVLGEGRVPKYHPRTEAVGTLDETSAALGLARASCVLPSSKELILMIQRDLYGLMAEAAATRENAARFRTITAERVTWLETHAEILSQQIEMPKEFIIPGDSLAGAALSLARTVVRRAERRVAELLHQDLVENTYLLSYLNRLSSLLFVLELVENQAAGNANPTLAKGSLAP